MCKRGVLSCYILQFETHLRIECTSPVKNLAKCRVPKYIPFLSAFQGVESDVFHPVQSDPGAGSLKSLWNKASPWFSGVLVGSQTFFLFFIFSESRTLCIADKLKWNMTFAAELELKCRVSCCVLEGSRCWPQMPKRYLNGSALNISN